jgi:hypothetical protein
MVWRQFCGCLSEGAAHLPTTVSQLLLEALLIADLRSELNTYLAPAGFVYLEFSWVQLPLLQVFPSPSTLGEVTLHPPSLAGVYLQFCEGLPLPPSVLRVPSPLCCMSFFWLLFITQFVFFLFFPGWRSVCPGGYADLAQGCLWEYCMPLTSPGGLCLSIQ